MSEFRKDPLSDRWVIFAEGREDRPNEYRLTNYQRSATRCPFCAGHEEDTPEPLAAYRGNGQTGQSDDWLVRVVPNKFPALTADVPLDTAIRSELQVQPQTARPAGCQLRFTAVGSHEVVIESARHVAGMTELSDEEVRLTLQAYQDRLQVLGQRNDLRYGLVFKNVGPAAGALLEHAHSQILATPMIPAEVHRELTMAAQWSSVHEKCIFCDLLEHERADGSRIVDQSASFSAFCPFASRMPYEMWILPQQHQSDFRQLESDQLTELAKFLQRILKKLESLHSHLAYNFFIHTAPFDTPALHHYHWHIEIIPRLTTTAGFEWGTDFFINPVLPERAAQAMRV